jgi:hypothetical protein
MLLLRVIAVLASSPEHAFSTPVDSWVADEATPSFSTGEFTRLEAPDDPASLYHEWDAEDMKKAGLPCSGVGVCFSVTTCYDAAYVLRPAA